MLVQITGTLRNLAVEEESYQQISQCKILSQLFTVLNEFKGHKELTLNISRILSKLSTVPQCSIEILKTQHLR